VSVAATPVAEAQTRRVVAAQPLQRPVSFVTEVGAPEGVLVLPLASEADLATRGAFLGEAERGAITRALAADEFSYGSRATLTLGGIGEWDKIVIIGLGEGAEARDYQRAGAALGRSLLGEDGPITFVASGVAAEATAEFATGLGIGEYRSDLYNTSERPASLAGTRIVADGAEARALYEQRGRALVEAMAFAR